MRELVEARCDHPEFTLARRRRCGLLAARQCGEKLVTVSGGVSCNRGLRDKLATRCQREGLTLLLARPELCTDNAGMIAYAAMQRFKLGQSSPLTADVDPNLPLVV